MARVIWSETALLDLEEIAEYIALDNVNAAKNLVSKVFESIERLEKHPELGRIPAELDNLRHRELVIGPCRAFYRVENTLVHILYIMRSERKFRKYILEERAKNS